MRNATFLISPFHFCQKCSKTLTPTQHFGVAWIVSASKRLTGATFWGCMDSLGEQTLDRCHFRAVGHGLSPAPSPPPAIGYDGNGFLGFLAERIHATPKC